MSSERYIPQYKVSGKAMNLIAEIAAAIERYIFREYSLGASAGILSGYSRFYRSW